MWTPSCSRRCWGYRPTAGTGRLPEWRTLLRTRPPGVGRCQHRHFVHRGHRGGRRGGRCGDGNHSGRGRCRRRSGRGCRGGYHRRLGGSRYDGRRRRHRGGVQDGPHRGFGHARRDDHDHPDDAEGHHDIKDPANHGRQPCIAASWIRGIPTWYRTRRPTWCGRLPSSYLPRSTFCQSNPWELASLRP